MCFASWQLDSRQLGFPGLVVNQKTFQAIKFPGYYTDQIRQLGFPGTIITRKT